MTEIHDSINTKKAVSFLKHFRKDGTHNIVAIDPANEGITGITRPNGHPDIAAFIEKHNGKANLYFSVNEPRSDAPNDKLKKSDIAKIHAVYLDADPRKDLPFEREKERLAKFVVDLKTSANPPTYVVDSGGGIQAFWLFDKPLDATQENVTLAESLSLGLAEQYGTDHVQNVDRIMRIPYTVNIPNERKAKLGRTRTTAKIAHADSPTGKRYQDMSFITPSQRGQQEQFEHMDLDMVAIKQPLPDELVERLRGTLDRDQKAHDLYYGLIEKPSRSEYDFTLAQQLVWDNYSLQEIAHILYHYTHGKNKDLTRREVIRIYNRVDNPFVGLDDGYIAKINAQVNPILAARAMGKPLEEDLKKAGAFKHRSAKDAALDWRHSGNAIYRNLMYDKSITVIYGQSNVGKSFVATDIAGHIALARDWGTFKYKPKQANGDKRPIGVLYICAEAGKSYNKRVKAVLQRLGVGEMPFHIIDDAPVFVKTMDDAKRVVLTIEEIEQQEGFSIGLVVVDTLATTFAGGNENSSEDMGMYISNMKWIQRYGDTGVLIVHHAGKDQAAGARGHSSLRAATDTEIEVLSDKRGDRYHRTIYTRKQRDGESGITIRFGLAVLELGKDEDNEPIDTCHVVLEGDDLFTATVPTAVDDPVVLAMTKARELYSTVPPDVKLKSKMDSDQITALLFKDIYMNSNVLISEDDKFDPRTLIFMQKPDSRGKVMTLYRRKLKEFNDIMSGIDV